MPPLQMTPDRIDRSSSVPMYDQLRRLILGAVEDGSLVPGDPLPGELRMCDEYQISRTVVRQALAQLEHEGTIERVKGKGTFISRPRTAERLAHTLLGLYDDVERRGQHVHSDVLGHRIVPAPTDVAAALEIAPGDPVVEIVRLRRIDGEPWSLATNWMREEIGRVTFGADLEEGSLYRVLREHGIVATTGVRSAEATVASIDEAEKLGVSVGAALLRLRSIARAADGTPIECFVALHRGDRSRFEFQIGADEQSSSLLLPLYDSSVR